MNDWKSCGNCKDQKCYMAVLESGFNTDSCNEWEPLPCEHCGGPLSEVRYHYGAAYRHCYACHSEFFLEEDQHEREKMAKCRGGLKTNADRIRRTMTDEELADEILELFAAFYEVEWSYESLLNWLKEEVVQ